MLIHLCIAYGHLHNVMAELSDSNKDHMAHKLCSIYSHKP